MIDPQNLVHIGQDGLVYSLTGGGVKPLSSALNLDALMEGARREQEEAALAMLNPWHMRRLGWWDRVVGWWRNRQAAP